VKKRVFVEPSFFLLLPLLFWDSHPAELLLFLGAVLLHETGHLLALLAFGACPRRITLSLSGAKLVTHNPYLPYKKEAIVFLSGPLAGFLGCIFAFFLLRWHFTEGGMLFFSFNLLLSLLNLLPVRGLDGGGILYALFCHFGEEYRAVRLAQALHGVSLAFLCAASLWVLKTEKNASLLILTLSLFSESAKKRKKATTVS